MESIKKNVNQVCADFRGIKEKIEANGVEVVDGTPTSEYADKVDEVYDAGRQAAYDEFWNSYMTNANGTERTDYRYAFAGCWNKALLKPPRPITIGTTSGHGLFWCFGGAGDEILDWREISHMFVFSGVKNATTMFDSAMIDYVDIDLFEATNLTRCFGSGEQASGHTHVTLGVSEKCTNYAGAFGANLTDLVFKEGSVVAANISFTISTKLTAESIQGVFEVLSPTVTGKTATFNAAHKTTYYNAHSDEYENEDAAWDALCAIKPNWTVVI